MQTKGDPEYYLRRDFGGREDSGETPFIDYRCSVFHGVVSTLFYTDIIQTVIVCFEGFWIMLINMRDLRVMRSALIR